MQIFYRAFQAFQKDNGPRIAASLTFFILISIIPLLLIIVSSVGLVYGDQAAQNELIKQADQVAGEQVATQISDIIKNQKSSNASTLSLITGICVMIYGATSTFIELQYAINTIWNIDPTKIKSSLLSHIISRLRSLVLIVVISVTLIIIITLGVVMAFLTEYIQSLTGSTTAFVYGMNLLVSTTFSAVLFLAIFKIIPSQTISWRSAVVGSVLTAVVQNAAKVVFGIYFAYVDVGSGYGAASSLIVLTIWAFYSIQIFLYGAEFTQVYDESRNQNQSTTSTPNTENIKRQNMSRANSFNQDSLAGEDTRPMFVRSTQGIIDEGKQLVNLHARLLSAEVVQIRITIAKTVAQVLIGAALTVVGIACVLISAIYALNFYVPSLPLWSCWLIVGATAIILGSIFSYTAYLSISKGKVLPQTSMKLIKEYFS